MAAAAVNVYPLESYKIGQKEERPDKDATMAARFNRMCVCLYDIVFFGCCRGSGDHAYSGAGCALCGQGDEVRERRAAQV
jgi:hypothetical protein